MDATADLDLRWHLVGHLQLNKARKAAARFDLIHSIDDVALARKLDEAAAETGRRPQLLVQVDLASEPTKHGSRPEDVFDILNTARSFTAARVVGLMLLPPAAAEPEATRRYFAALSRLRDELVGRGVDPAMLDNLSMGMSHDFEVAIEEGATMVRVGSAIFGDRAPL
jgi:hypothetical protein